ncbi:MAG: DEAD/DEAH box helicase [Candidatus Cloacimonetes bacterium]|nr:DEAD/DEAH box helicase [Candidatus Cloacimonadota bacterium]
MSKLEKFRELGLSEETISAIAKKGFEEPSQIQALTIPKLLENTIDIIGQAQTGTGKTAAFGLPIVERIIPGKGFVQALILVPTRELAIQVAEELSSFRGNKDISILPVYGGQSIDTQLRRLKKGVEIVVGTPGRVIDHIKRRTLDLSQIGYFILDEADEMLNMGFLEDIEIIFATTPKEKRTLLFSATMPTRIQKLASNYMPKYELLKVKAKLTADLTDQIYFEVHEASKLEALCRIIDIESEFYALVFCRTRNKADDVARKLSDRGYEAAALHGDITQHQREKILNSFKRKRINILVATDVAARGIDIDDLTHVINYSIPQNPEAYVHRIGRTGRAGRQGTAITFITPSEFRKLMRIQQQTKVEIRKEKLPKVKNVISKKRERVIAEITNILENGNFEDNLPISYELLAKYNADNVIAALMTHAYKDEFSITKYASIDEPSARSKRHPNENYALEENGKTRLFIALGKSDGMDPRKLIDFIQKNAKVDARNIRGLKVFDNFSFANVPFEDAEIIIQTFRNKGRNNKPLVTKAKEKSDSPDRSDRRSDRPKHRR